MSAPVTHILAPMILLELYRRYIHPSFSKKEFPYWMVLIGGLGGLIPDFDILVGHAFTKITHMHIYFHRMWSHSLFIIIPIVLIGVGLIYWNRKISKNYLRYTYLILFAISFGMMTHILLDVINGPMRPFYPLLFQTGYNWYGGPIGTMVFDGFMLILWIIYDKRIFEPVYNYFALRMFGKKYVIK